MLLSPVHDYNVFFRAFQVNSEVVTLPLLREPYIYVERQTNTILLNTNIGLKVCGLSLLFFCLFFIFRTPLTLSHPRGHL